MVVCIRTALGAVVLYALMRLRNRDALRALREVVRAPWTVLAFGTTAIAAPFLLIAVGERHVPSGLTAVLIAAAPLFVAVFAPFLDPSEKVRGARAAGFAIGFAGVALLVGVETIHSLAQFLSALGIVAAAGCYTLSTFIVKRTYRAVPSLAISFTSVGAGALLTLPFAVATPPSHAPGWRSLFALVVLGVAGTAIAFVLFYRLITELGPGRASLVSYLIPPISLTYGALLLDERITPAAIAGLVLILGGVALGSRGPAPGAEVPAPEGAEAAGAEAR
jgi:drug/metabolite transporter (DMT)-like permease